MDIPKMKIFIYVLTFLGYAFSGYGSGIIENLRDAVVMAEGYFGQILDITGQFLKRVGEGQKILQESDDNCVFTCKSGGTPVKNKYHKPSYNGCGTDLFPLKIIESIPAGDMKKCCNQHDLCYDTCNRLKKDCDEEFKQCLYKICSNLTAEETLVKACKVAASMISGSMSLGCQSYMNSQKRSCYCPNDDKRKKFTAGGEL